MSKKLVKKIEVEILSLEGQIKSITERKQRLEQMYAELTCPYKVGDIVVCKGYVYSGQKGQVTVIKAKRVYSVEKHRYCPGWVVFMAILKKDGSTGLKIGQFSSDQYKKERD